LEEVSKCSAVVLVGDSEGDVTMADGLGADTVLKIGFLNISTSHELVTRYAELFDVVLLDDAPAWEVEDIVRELIQSGP
jgi:5'-nucleotidase